MSDIFKERHAKLGCMVLRLFPKVMQMILKDYITPKGLQTRFLKNDFRFVFTNNEVALMEKLPDMDNFTVEISYKILRFELLHEPKCKWGNVPHYTDVEIADDIQRIIHAANSIIKINTNNVTENYSENLLEEIKMMVTRIDSYLKQDDLRSLYNRLCRSETDSNAILQDLTRVKSIEESQPDTERDKRERYSRLSIPIIDIFPKILRDVIRKCEPVAKCLHQKCVPILTTFYPEQQRIIKELQYSNTYDSLDVTLIYQIFRRLKLIPSPTKGWGKLPDKVDINLGDDIERIRCYKNNLAHRSDTKIENNEFNEYFNEFRSIGHRMDLNFFQTTNYEQEIVGYRTCVMDTAMQAKYENAMMEIENIKLRFEKRPIKFYWGDDFDTCLTNLRSLLRDEKLEGRGNIRLQIIFQNEEDIEKSIGILNSLTEEINEGLCKIEFIVATKVCRIPEQIKKMDQESIDIYLNALESGSERRRDINLIIVGKKGVGKTSLVRRMFGEELKGVKKTNGIDIHRRRCHINLSDMEWKKVPDTTLVREKSINNRIMQVMINTLNREKEEAKRNISKNKAKTSFSGMTETDENEETVTLKATTQSTEHSQETQPKMNYELDIPQITEISFLKHERELSSIINSDIDIQDDDSYAMLTVWDFAGDIEYYNTHQTFLNPEAIYLVVASLHDIDDTDSYGTFNFWMDTIHCYGNVADKNEGLLQSDGTDNLLDPPVIAIGTHKDKFQDENQCRELLASYTDTIFKDSKLHLRSTHLLSNTNDKEQAFRKLRNEIFTTASNSQNWNREYPVKFIQLEKAINSELKQIIPFDRVKELGANISIPITDDKELRLFLRFQHEVGNLIYYEDIPSYIILDPQWLVNAFKCIVTAKQFQLKLPHLQWEELKQTGKMDKKLLDAILQKQSDDMPIHKEHILEVIEKFDIIIYPSLLTDCGNVQKETCFYVPCLIQTSKIEDIDKLFNVPDSCKSTCLCFIFRFLPPHLISNLFVSCLRAYPLAAVRGQKGIFKDSCVFNISKSGCAKFVLAKSNHMIELQVWQWRKANLKRNQDVLQFVEMEINRIVNTRYKLKTVSFEKKWKCETTSYSFDKGFHELDEMHDGEFYFCEEHATIHRYEDHWSGEKTKEPEELNNEQRNFTRLSMVVLDILRTVLYDQLDLDKNLGQLLFPCDQYDITSLYQEHRKLNKHIPSKRRWGGGRTVDDIPPNEACIGDDIERIRLIRNEMQHSTVFALDATRYQSLIAIIEKMLSRFDQRNNLTEDHYVNRLQDIRKMELKTRNHEDIMGLIKKGLKRKFDEFVDTLDI